MSEGRIKVMRRRPAKNKGMSQGHALKDGNSYSDTVSRVVDDAPVVVVKLDSTGRCVFINRGAERILHKSAGDCYGRELYEVFDYSAPDQFSCQAALLRTLSGEEGHQCQIALEREGLQREYVLTFTPGQPDESQKCAVHIVAIDISSLRESLLKVQRSLQLKERFLSILAHELRNPLSAILAGLKILETTSDESQVAQAKEMMERQVRHLTRLVNDLLDVSRIKQGKISLVKTKTSLRDVLTLALDSGRQSVRKKQHSLELCVPNEALELEVDSNRLAQVVSNLLDNAAKYTPPGGKIFLNAAAQANQLVISVSDNGVGIPQERLTQIFEVYTQLDQSRADFGGGLGIGLYLVKMITEGHGGTVHANSNGHGKGSEFVVRIPLVNHE